MPDKTEISYNESVAKISWLLTLLLLPIFIFTFAVLGPWLAKFSGSSPENCNLLLDRWIVVCAPEPIEQARYLLAIVCLPVGFYLGLLCIERRISSHNAKISKIFGWLATKQKSFVLIIQWMLTAAIVFMFIESQEIRDILSLNLILLPVSLVLFNCLLREKSKFYLKLSLKWCWAIAIFLIVYELSTGTFTTKTIGNGTAGFHFHLPYTSGEFAAILNGRSPWVDFYPQYQTLISYLLVPYFHIFKFSVGSFTLGMALLSLIGFSICFWIFTVIAKRAQQALALFLPVLFLSFCPFDQNQYCVTNTFNYFAVGPLRYFWPWLTVGACVYYWQKSTNFRMFLVCFFGATATLNNLDFGLPAFAASMIALVLNDVKYGFLFPSFPKLLRLGTQVILACAATLLLFFAITWFHSGRIPDLSMIIMFQKVFVKVGFAMVPLPAFGFYWIMGFTWLIAIFRGVVASRKSARDAEERTLSGLLIYSGIFGLGIFTYYIGRSVWQNMVALFSAWAFTLALLFWDLWKSDVVLTGEVVRTHLFRSRPIPAWWTLIGYLISLGSMYYLPNPSSLMDRMSKPRVDFRLVDPLLIYFIKDHIAVGSPIVIIYPYGHEIATETKMQNIYPFAGTSSLLLKSQIPLVMKEIKDHRSQWVLGDIQIELQRALEADGFERLNPVHKECDVWRKKGFSSNNAS